MTVSLMVHEDFYSQSVASTVEYRVRMPPDGSRVDGLPLILHLHGAMSSSAFLDVAKPSYESAWTTGVLPPAIVACASTPTSGGFYIDYSDGPFWERLVGTELPEHLATQFALNESQAVLGFSMGGYGALKLAFRAPDRYRAVAALCPAIFPAESLDEVPAKNRPAILGELNHAMGAAPYGYSGNCVPTLLRQNIDVVRESALKILVDCGNKDEFALHDGSMYLHQLMLDLNIDHDWESLPNCGHADRGAERLAKALTFLGSALA